MCPLEIYLFINDNSKRINWRPNAYLCGISLDIILLYLNIVSIIDLKYIATKSCSISIASRVHCCCECYGAIYWTRVVKEEQHTVRRYCLHIPGWIKDVVECWRNCGLRCDDSIAIYFLHDSQVIIILVLPSFTIIASIAKCFIVSVENVLFSHDFFISISSINKEIDRWEWWSTATCCPQFACLQLTSAVCISTWKIWKTANL